ncbi:solute carrier family 22 member 21-like isoform X2 [Babylonia areolata]|uniref:solute carrier family 22 member 21-like isoform X2 n=1 Tax=Babylonia areolata TaxID=304850 RepID=UPI003FD00DFB
MMATLESLVEEVGPFGRFQIMLITFTLPTLFIAVMSMMFMVFGAVEPDWWCVSRDQQSQLSLSLWNESMADTGVTVLPFASDGQRTTGRNFTSTKACEVMREGGGTCERIEFSPGMNTIVTEFQLVCDLSWVPSLTISLQMVGVLIGAFLAGQLSDSVGRKKAVISFTALHAVFNLIAAFSVTWQMFAVMITLIGTTIGGLLVTTFPYHTEFMGVRRRAVVATIPFWGLGSVLFSLLCWAVPHWKVLRLLIAAGSVLCLPLWTFLPESVRWLIVKGHVTKAQRVLCMMARWNGRNPPNLSSVQALCSDSDHTQRKYSYFHIFSTCRIMKLSCMSGFMWMTAALAYYAITFGIKNLSGHFHLNFFLMVLMETPACMLVYHLSGWLGRRWATFSGFLVVSLTLLSAVPITLLLSEDSAGNYITVLCSAARFFLQLGWGVMALFHTELYPTVVRAIGVGYCHTISRCGAILAPYLMSLGASYIYAILGVAMAVTAVVPLLLPETRGQPLPDDLEDKQGEVDAGMQTKDDMELSAISVTNVKIQPRKVA